MTPGATRAVLLGSLLAAGLAQAATESPARIEQAARSFALAQARSYGGTPEVAVTPLDPRLQLVGCDRPLEAALAPGARPVGHTSVAVRCPGPHPWSVYVQARVRILAEVLVAARPLARGVPLTHGDLAVQRQDLTAVAAGALTDPAQVVGQRLRYPLAAGALLNAGLLQRSPLIRRGQTVTLISGRDGFEVSQSGEALADAAAGDSLKVRNPLTRRVIEGTVEAAGRVRVPL
jgi:flagella basal body P-ring formation protein FlgA